MSRSNPRVVLSVLALFGWFTVGTLPAGAAFCDAPVATITLTNGDDVLLAAASPGGDVIVGLAGDDTINGGAGNDSICGGSGNDIISVDEPGGGTDKVFGGSGDDNIDGDGDGLVDELFGDSGDDILFDSISPVDGGSGTDACNGATELNCP